MRQVLTFSILFLVTAAGAQGFLREGSANEPDRLHALAEDHPDQLDATTSWRLGLSINMPSQNVIVVAESDVLIQQDASLYQQELDSMLERNDIAAARKFVDALVDSPGLTPTLLHSMKEQIWRAKAERMVEYSKKFKAAIAASDLASMKDYSERMQRLTASSSSEDFRPSDFGTTQPAKSLGLSADLGLDEPPSDLTKPADAHAPTRSADVDPISQQMRRAFKEGRLLPPAQDNAFDLAAARLSTRPGDATAHGIVNQIIETWKAQIATYVGNDQPEKALEFARQLLDALGSSEAEDSWRAGYRSKARQWFDQKHSDIVAGLIGKCEEAIDKRDLTIASYSALPAYGYLDLLAFLLGDDHNDVVRLTATLITTYRNLIGQRLARQQYEGAMTLVKRVEPIAARFDTAIDEIQTLRSEIESKQARQ